MFSGVPVSYLLNVQRENVCNKDPFYGENKKKSVMSSSEIVVLVTYRAICVYHTHANVYLLCACFRFWRWKYSSDLSSQVSVHYSVKSQALYLKNSLTLLIWMCVETFTSCTGWRRHYPHILNFIHQQNHILLLFLLFAVYSFFLNALTVTICLRWKCGACYTAPLLDFSWNVCLR